MKAYYYTPAECGKANPFWRVASRFGAGRWLARMAGTLAGEPCKGPLRLDPAIIEPTIYPLDADCFVCPYPLNEMGTPMLVDDDSETLWNYGWRGHYLNDFAGAYRLPYLQGNEARHVFFNVSDACRSSLNLPAIVFRCDMTAALHAVNPSAEAWPWPALDRGPVQDAPFEYDICFVGWNSTDLNKLAMKSCEQAGLRCMFDAIGEFWGGYEGTPKAAEREATFLRALHRSRLSLCVRSIPDGVVRYRWYEALSAGRVPVLIGDGTAIRGPRSPHMLHIRERDTQHTGQIVKEWLAKTPDDEVVRLGRENRTIWEQQYDPAKWPTMMAQAVVNRLRA